MITLTIPYIPRFARRPLRRESSQASDLSGKRSLLLFSNDDNFSDHLQAAGDSAGWKLVRETAAALEQLPLIKTDAVLIDLDLASSSVWDTADRLLQNESSPPLFLLTSRSDQADFQAAIEAGSVIDKRGAPDRLLALIYSTLESPLPVHRQRMAMQQLVIRWLKPCDWLPETAPLHRFWGINE